ncbi:MAG TPA: hypothetical protein VFI31_15445 [Pirellulales bacterium]|nr:hypothetical protein [Pirellulales bacterium]
MIERGRLASCFRAGLAGWLLAACATVAQAQAPSADLRAKLQNMELLFCFQGKGSSMSYDAGVLKHAFDYLPALAQRKVVITGNSSGSIFAIYFSCHGFTKASVDYAAYRIQHADIEAVRKSENAMGKFARLATNRPTEVSPEGLKEYIAFALGVENWRDAAKVEDVVRRSRLKPVFPVVIVAANKEVLDNRAEGNALSAKNYKEFNPDNFAVSWKQDVFDFYRKHPDRFAKDNPDLRLGDDPYIGKACTCFVDRTMFELLRQIPEEERLCDLRLMTDAADMALAIRASTAEPTYYPPAPETDYAKLYVGGRLGSAGRSRRRSYVGGFIMPMVAHDTRRMLPGVRVMGTGVARVAIIGRELVKAWYLVDLQNTTDQNAWWTDLEVVIPPDTQTAIANRTLNQKDEYDAGYKQAGEVLAIDRGRPKYVLEPKYRYAADAAIYPPNAKRDDIQEPASPAEHPALKTMRGLGPLLRRP